MRMLFKVALVASLASISALPSVAQVLEVPAAETPRTDDLDQSIASFRADLDRFDRALERRNRKARSNALKVTAKGKSKSLKGAPTIGNAAQNAALRDLYETQIAQWVAASGDAAPAAGGSIASDSELIDAADSLFALKASADQKAALADGVYEATFVAQENEQLGDGHNSTLRFTIDEVVKGEAGQTSIGVRVVSGKLPSGLTLVNSAEFVPQAGAKIMIFTSRGVYDQQAQLNGGVASTAAGYTAYSSAPYLLNRDELLATATGQPRDGRGKSAVKASIKAKK